jgi:hypothetical protein
MAALAAPWSFAAPFFRICKIQVILYMQLMETKICSKLNEMGKKP